MPRQPTALGRSFQNHDIKKRGLSRFAVWILPQLRREVLTGDGRNCAPEATLDNRDLRSLLDCSRLVRRTAVQTAVRMITTGAMLVLLAGIAIKLKIFGVGPKLRPIPFISPTAPAFEAVFLFLEDIMTTTLKDHWRDVPKNAW